MSARFSESWLKNYEARQQRGFAVELPDTFGFTLQRPILLLNRLLRLHWAERSAYANELSEEIAGLTRHLPAGAKPLDRARVTVTRYSMGTADQDNLTAAVKPLLDALLVRSATHPAGLGFLVDDAPAHLELIVRGQQAEKRTAQRTVVLVERIAA